MDPKRHCWNYKFWNAQNTAFSFAFPQWTLQYLLTFTEHCTKGPACWSEYSSPHKQNGNLKNGLWLSLVHRYDIKPSVLGQDSTSLLHQSPRPSENPLSNPLLKGKAHSAGAKTNRRHIQKGLVTNRSDPGLFTHHFNTAANYNRLKSVHMTK